MTLGTENANQTIVECDLAEHMNGAKVIDLSLYCTGDGQHQVIIEFDNGFIMKTLFDKTIWWHPILQ